MKVRVLYNLDKAEAIKRIKNLLVELQTEYKGQISDVQSSWSNSQANYSFKMNGLKINGTIFVSAIDVVIDGKLPFIAMAFKGQIENVIKQKAKELLK